MSNFFEDHFHLEWVNIFILGGNEHGSDSNDVEVSHFSGVVLAFEEAVEDGDREEEGLVIALEVGKHFNHPVNHARAESWRYFVLYQTIMSVELNFQFSLVLVNIFSVVLNNVSGLPLDFSLLQWNLLHLLRVLIEDLRNLEDIINLLLQIETLIAQRKLTRRVAQNPIILLVVHIIIIGDDERLSLEELII
jgi:hypothetical protein